MLWLIVCVEWFDCKLIVDMVVVMKVVELGCVVWGVYNFKIWQLFVGVQVCVVLFEVLDVLKCLQMQIMEELNVKVVIFLEGDIDFVQYSLCLNLLVVGKQYGKQFLVLKKVLIEVDVCVVVMVVQVGQGFSVQVDGVIFDLMLGSVLVDVKVFEGVVVVEDVGYLVVFDIVLIFELVCEGLVCDFVCVIQEVCKVVGFEVQDWIVFVLELDGEVLEVVQVWQDFIVGEVLVEQVVYGFGEGFCVEVEGGVVMFKKF